MFQLLRDGTPRTRSELAVQTGQARSTIAVRIDLLSSAGLIGPVGEATSTGGRPPATFAFNPAARVVLSMDLGAVHARLAVADLAANIIVAHEEALAISGGPVAVLERARPRPLGEGRPSGYRPRRNWYWATRSRRTPHRPSDRPADYARLERIRCCRDAETGVPCAGLS